MTAGSGDRFRRLLTTAWSRTVVGYLVGAFTLIIAILLLGHELELHIQALEHWLADLGPWRFVAFAFVLALGTSILLPESIFGVAAGVLFGLPWGVAACFTGNLLAASLQYGLSRWLLQERIRQKVASRPTLAAIERAVLHDELRLQFLVRLMPLNAALVSYLLGAAGVRFRGFLLACIALLPHLLLEVSIGHTGKQVVRLTLGSRGTTVYDLAALAGLALVVVAVALISRSAEKAMKKLTRGDDPESHQDPVRTR